MVAGLVLLALLLGGCGVYYCREGTLKDATAGTTFQAYRCSSNPDDLTKPGAP